MHFPSLCAVSWRFHTVTEMSFILVGPVMPFCFHQSQYRLLNVTDSIPLSIRSLNLMQMSFKISEIQVVICCSLLNYRSSTSRKTLWKTTTVTLSHYKGSQPRWIEGGHSLNWLRLLCATMVFRDILSLFCVLNKVSFRTGILKKSVKIDDARSAWEEPTMYF